MDQLTPLAAEPPALAARRYTLTAQAFHWLTALLILAIVPVAWVMMALPKGPDRDTVFVIHRSIGITIITLVAMRLIWRATHPAPPLPGSTPRFLEMIGRVNHWLLYALLIVMPVTGYVQSANGRPVSYFGLFDLPALPKNDTLDSIGETMHVTGQWIVYALVALHVLATVWHVAVRRDGLLNRMIPAQDDTART